MGIRRAPPPAWRGYGHAWRQGFSRSGAHGAPARARIPHRARGSGRRGSRHACRERRHEIVALAPPIPGDSHARERLSAHRSGLVLRVSLDLPAMTTAPPRALLAVVMAIAAMALVRLAYAQLLSPGPLSKAHASLAGDQPCNDCHSSGKGVHNA